MISSQPFCVIARRFLNAIQTNAQHLVRYLAVAAVVNKRRRNVMKDLMRLIEQESYQVSDPVTDFLQCLFTNYDFDGAQEKLQECEQVLLLNYLSASTDFTVFVLTLYYDMVVATLVAGVLINQAAEQSISKVISAVGTKVAKLVLAVPAGH